MLRLVQVPEGEGVLGVRALSLYASQLQDLIFYVPTVVCILWGLLFSEGVNAGVHPANGLALALLTVEARGTMMPSMNFDRFLRSYTTGAYAQTLFQGLWTLLKGLCTGGPAVVTGHSVPFTMSWWLTVGILVELHFARRFLAWREWPFQIDMVGGWVGGWMRITKLGVFVLAAWVVESASLVLILITRPSAMTIAYLFGWEILCVMEHFLIFIWERIRRRTASGTPVDQRVTAGSSSSNSATSGLAPAVHVQVQQPSASSSLALRLTNVGVNRLRHNNGQDEEPLQEGSVASQHEGNGASPSHDDWDY
eukprot:Cvel_2558.t1-p1 / transcript=Cvel_2558.t1 / gene=Cvel_2558 / organism=Chromera_velia_CCMP2878 / gene_product=hypothetical protein / transcript_product=hypothetical protein / location=Cvel_scaffold101:46622-50125(+) / protein_length=308 / sequence_SO=supercontig / SO=protein_coding / is_pseudo=false